MAVQVACDSCGARLTLKDDSRLGQKMKCPKCESVFVAEEAEAEAPAKKKSSDTKSKSGPAKGKKGAGKGKGKKKGSSGGFPVVPVAIGGVVLLALIGVGVWFAFFRSADAPGPAPVADANAADPAMDPAAMPGEPGAEAPAAAGADNAAPPAEPQAQAAAIVPGVLNTEWLPNDSLFVMSVKPASLMNSAMLKPLLESPLAKLALTGYELQYGLKLQNLESITVGMAMDLTKLPVGGAPAPGAAPPMPPLPQMVTVLRLSSDFDDAGAQKLAQVFSTQNQQAALAMNRNSGTGVPGSEGMEYDLTMTDTDAGTSALGDARARMNPGAAGMDSSSAPGGSVPSSGDAAPGMDPMGEMTMEGEAGSSAAPVPNVYPIAPGPRIPNAPPQQQTGLALANPRTVLMAPLDLLKQMVAAKPTNPQGPFAFVKQDGDFVIAGQFEFVPQVKQLLEKAPPAVSASFSPMFELYEQGARGGSLALSLTDQLDVSLSVGGKDADSARKLSDDLQAKMKAAAQAPEGDEAAAVPETVQEVLQTLTSQLKVEQSETVSTISFHLSREMLTDLGKEAMSSAGDLLSSHPGLLNSIGGSELEKALPSLSQPKLPRRPLTGTSRPADTAEGLPEKTKLAVVAHWPEIEVPGVPLPHKVEDEAAAGRAGRGRPQPRGGSAPRTDVPPMSLPETDATMTQPGQTDGTAAEPPPPGIKETILELGLVVTGRKADEIVQYQEPVITAALDSAGRPLKRRNGMMIPLSTPQTWGEAVGVKIEPRKQDGTLIPIRFDASSDVTAVAELTGTVEIRVSENVQQIFLDPKNPQALPLPQLEAAGVRVVIGAKEQGSPIYLLPASEETVLIGLHPAPEGMTAPLPGGAGQLAGGFDPTMSSDAMAGQFAGSNLSPAPGSSEEEMRRMMEESAAAGGAGPSMQPGGNPNARPTGKLEAAPVRIGHVASWNPTGFQIPPGHATPLILRVARQPRTQTVAFSFKDVAVPPRPEGGEARYGDWVRLSDGVELSEGLTTAYARTEWAPSDPDGKRSRLNVWIDLIGPDADKVFAVGAYALETATVPDGKSVNLDDKHPEAVERPKGFDSIDPRASGVRTPPQTCRMNFPLLVLSQDFDALTSLAGSIRLKSSTGIESVTIEKLGDLVGKRISHPVLTAEKAAPQLTYAEGLATLTFSGTTRDRILSIELVDAAGQYDPSYPFLISRQDKEDRYSFRIDEKAFKKLGLRVVLHKGFKNSGFAFKFENVPVPPPPAPPAEVEE